MPPFAPFERAMRRLNPLPAQRRDWAERDMSVARHLAASAQIDNAVLERLS